MTGLSLRPLTKFGFEITYFLSKFVLDKVCKMRTEIASLGRAAAIERLFENTGFQNEQSTVICEKGECLLAHKILLEGVDFDLVFNPLKHLGYKAVLAVAGEIYAKFHQPNSLSVTLGISKKFCYEDIEELWQGIIAAAKEHSIKHLSLDLVPSMNGLCISIAVCGTQRKGNLEKIVPSKNMDLICLTGDLGAAYMGLHVLQREKVSFTDESKQPDLSKYKYVLGSYLNPEINPGILSRFIEAGIYPSKGYFITKGLAEAIHRLTKDTGFGAKIYLEKIPLASGTIEMAEEVGMEPVTAAFNGGDDYKFIFTVPIECHDIVRKEFHDFDIIGHLAKPEVGAVMVTPEGAEFEIKTL